MMKPLILALVPLAALSTASTVLAVEDHAEAVGVFDWIPLRPTSDRYPTVHPYKDHNLHSVVFQKQANGRFQMALELPEDLSAGIKTVLTLNETSRSLDASTYVFQDTRGSRLTCGVGDSWLSSGCKVEYLYMPGTPEERRAFVTAKYLGTRMQEPMALIAVLTRSEPFGRLRLSDPAFQLEGSTYGNGHWNIRYETAPNQWVTGKMFIDFYRGVFAPQNGRVALLSGFYYEENKAEAGWSYSDDEFGWIRLTFNGNSFEGTWGPSGSETPTGRWQGTKE